LDGALAIQLILVRFLLSGLFLSSGACLVGAFDFLLLREYVGQCAFAAEYIAAST
jgi:hypothetical protein